MSRAHADRARAATAWPFSGSLNRATSADLSRSPSALRSGRCRHGLAISLSFLEHALRHLELPARGSQSLREDLPDPRVFIRIVDFRAAGIRHQGRGERVQVVVPSAELHEARRRLAAVEMLVEPLERRHHEGSFLPVELLHLLLLAVLEGRRADLVRPHHAESAAVEKDDGRARPRGGGSARKCPSGTAPRAGPWCCAPWRSGCRNPRRPGPPGAIPPSTRSERS